MHYVTLDDLGRMVKDGEDFVVIDAKTGENIQISRFVRFRVGEGNE